MANLPGTTNDPQQSQRKDITRESQSGLRRYGSSFHSNPFYLMRRMSEEMDRLFGEFTSGRDSAGFDAWAPAIEVQERDGKHIVHAELPGLSPDDVKVEIENDLLVIQGERRSEQQSTEEGSRRTERHYGRFYRAIPLPEGANAEQAHASFRDGVLEVSMPVTQAQPRTRKIPIESNPSGGGTHKAA